MEALPAHQRWDLPMTCTEIQWAEHPGDAEALLSPRKDPNPGLYTSPGLAVLTRICAATCRSCRASHALQGPDHGSLPGRRSEMSFSWTPSSCSEAGSTSSWARLALERLRFGEQVLNSQDFSSPYLSATWAVISRYSGHCSRTNVANAVCLDVPGASSTRCPYSISPRVTMEMNSREIYPVCGSGWRTVCMWRRTLACS